MYFKKHIWNKFLRATKKRRVHMVLEFCDACEPDVWKIPKRRFRKMPEASVQLRPGEVEPSVEDILKVFEDRAIAATAKYCVGRDPSTFLLPSEQPTYYGHDGTPIPRYKTIVANVRMEAHIAEMKRKKKEERIKAACVETLERMKYEAKRRHEDSLLRNSTIPNGFKSWSEYWWWVESTPEGIRYAKKGRRKIKIDPKPEFKSVVKSKTDDKFSSELDSSEGQSSDNSSNDRSSFSSAVQDTVPASNSPVFDNFNKHVSKG